MSLNYQIERARNSWPNLVVILIQASTNTKANLGQVIVDQVISKWFLR